MSLRTVSLRRRVTLSVIGVLGVVLVGVVLSVDALFAAQSNRDVETALLEKARVAQQLVKQQVRGRELVDRLAGRGVEVRLVMPDGAVYGDVPGEEVAHEVSRQLVDGSWITVYAESSVITAAQARLRRLLLLVGIGAMAVTAGAMVWVVRRALAPLDAMTTLARAIARGNRGHRLTPSRTDNELGRTAAAFDDMLDSLEGSEERTRRFVADAAHELRTPIAGVQAVAEALMQSAGAEERERLNLLLVRESRRAGRLVDDLLALAHIDVGLELHRERVDLLALAEAEVARTRLLAPEFDIAAEGGSAFVSGDPQRLAQVLANLADNARQATGPSGRVRLRVSRAGGFALLVVSDNGPGVPPAERERVFDRLVRLDEARDRRSGGSGLGLSIARGVVRAHGGELSCVDPGRADLPGGVTTNASAEQNPPSPVEAAHANGNAPAPSAPAPSAPAPGAPPHGQAPAGGSPTADAPAPAEAPAATATSGTRASGTGGSGTGGSAGGESPSGASTAGLKWAAARIGARAESEPARGASAGDARMASTPARRASGVGEAAVGAEGGVVDGGTVARSADAGGWSRGGAEVSGAVFEVRIPLAD